MKNLSKINIISLFFHSLLRFDGVFIDDTDLTTTVGRVITIMPTPNPIAVKLLDFVPRN